MGALYHLFMKKSPHSLFGGSRKLTWGGFAKGTDNVNAHFSSVYGITRINGDLKMKNREILDIKFPKHKLFGD